MEYLFVKKLHIILVITSISLFILRFYWALNQADMLRHQLIRTLPHIIDTLLLSAGIYLMISAKLWPTQHPWLGIKLICLIVYIGLGTFAIKRGKTQGIKLISGLGAISVFAYMAGLAFFKSPLWFLP